jgi:hypothetical protein
LGLPLDASKVSIKVGLIEASEQLFEHHLLAGRQF